MQWTTNSSFFQCFQRSGSSRCYDSRQQFNDKDGNQNGLTDLKIHAPIFHAVFNALQTIANAHRVILLPSSLPFVQYLWWILFRNEPIFSNKPYFCFGCRGSPVRGARKTQLFVWKTTTRKITWCLNTTATFVPWGFVFKTQWVLHHSIKRCVWYHATMVRNDLPAEPSIWSIFIEGG